MEPMSLRAKSLRAILHVQIKEPMSLRAILYVQIMEPMSLRAIL